MTVVDSSVLIHLGRIGKLELLHKLFKKVLITPDVYEEINKGIGSSEITKACKDWIAIAETDGNAAEQVGRSEGIEKADASVIILAQKNDTLLISNDYALIMAARSKGVECWWLTTLLLKCVRRKILSKNKAKKVLLELVKTGMRLDNAVYAAVLNEIEQL